MSAPHIGVALLCFAAQAIAPFAAKAAQNIPITYPTPHGDAVWQLRVAGTQVVGLDDAGRRQWSVSPSEGAAPDCGGVTQIALLTDDTNADGRIDAPQGERARLVVSSSWRNGGGWDSAVMMLDVSLPGSAKELWRQDSGNLPSLARLVAEPAVATVRTFHTAGAAHSNSSAPNVVMLGAGLPTPATPRHEARSGAPLLLLDVNDGHELWRAAASGRPTQTFPALTAGMSGAVTALDMNRDGYTDRLYVGDAVATLWRFDIAPDALRIDSLMTGGPIAKLTSPANATARSLIAAPDVTLFAPPGAVPWLNIAIGTTYAGTGTSPITQGLFVLRDLHPFDALSQADYDAMTVATPAALQGGYTIDTGTEGIVGRALTASGVLLYTQVSGDPLQQCGTTPTVIVKATPVQADTGTALPDTADTPRSSGPRTRRDLQSSDGTPASPFDAPTPLLEDIPALHRLMRRYWRRTDAE